jgi:hypothetical protein
MGKISAIGDLPTSKIYHKTGENQFAEKWNGRCPSCIDRPFACALFGTYSPQVACPTRLIYDQPEFPAASEHEDTNSSESPNATVTSVSAHRVQIGHPEALELNSEAEPI